MYAYNFPQWFESNYTIDICSHSQISIVNMSKICCVNILIIENRWHDLRDFNSDSSKLNTKDGIFLI